MKISLSFRHCMLASLGSPVELKFVTLLFEGETLIVCAEPDEAPENMLIWDSMIDGRKRFPTEEEIQQREQYYQKGHQQES